MNARETAFKILLKGEKTKQYSNIAVDNALNTSDMSKSDKALTSALVYGVTERKITLDYYISKLSSRDIKKIDSETLCALRLGIYQLAFMDKIPAHAAVNETVSLCKRSCTGFVNAILRSYQRLEEPIKMPDINGNKAEYLSVKYSVCKPLVKKFLLTFPFEKTESILKSYFNTPKTTLRVNTLNSSVGELLDNIPSSCKSEISPVGVKVSGSVKELYGFEEGKFFVQDEASQICVGALDAKKGDTLIDCCSCPGSKSFGAAIDMENTGKIYSFDLHENKLSLVNSGAKRLGIDIINTGVLDGRTFKEELEGVADKVLCDVPCSGFGVIAKKPELRYKDPEESKALPKIQQDILCNCSKYVKVGGTLVYSTCTLLPEENENNIELFLKNYKNFKLCPFTFGKIKSEGMLTLYPDTDSTDGFFVARMVKIK